MNDMHLRKYDLNLLVILAVLLEECHISNAGKRLGLSQSAVSHALQRCRAIFSDPLLLRGSKKMAITQKGAQLKQSLDIFIKSTEEIFYSKPKNLLQISQKVKLHLSDACSRVLLVPLLKILSEKAPNVEIITLKWQNQENALSALTRSSADMIISADVRTHPSLIIDHLSCEKFIAIAAKDNPINNSPDMNEWLEYKHIVVSSDGEKYTNIDRELGRFNLSRKVAIVVSSFYDAIDIVRNTNFIALAPIGAFGRDEISGLKIIKPPMEINGFDLVLVTHIRNKQNEIIKFIRATIKDIFFENNENSRNFIG